MKNRFYILFLIVFLNILFSINNMAQNNRGATVKPAGSTQTSEKRLALVIGNSAYQNASVLSNPINDATDMVTLLKSLGFEVISGMNQTRSQMRSLIRQFGEKLQQQKGAGLFYYAGHGIQASGRNYLIPVEAEIASEFEAEDAALDVNAVLRQMDGAGNGFNIVILDACRNNPFARGWKRDISSGGLAQISAPNGTLIAYATAPESTAGDGNGRNGLYTSELLEQMKRPNVDLLRMFQNVRTQVKQKSGGRQIPWESNSTTGDFYFAGVTNINPPTVQPNIASDSAAIEKEFWEKVKNSADIEDYKMYKDKYPNGIYTSLADLNIKRLASAVDKQNEVPKTSQPASGKSFTSINDYRKKWEDMLKEGNHKAVISETTAELARNRLNYIALRMRVAAYENSGLYVSSLGGNNNIQLNDSIKNDLNEIVRLLSSPKTSEEYEARCFANRVMYNGNLAIEDCTKAIDLSPNFADAYFNRAVGSREVGLFAKAVEDYKKVIEIRPELAAKTYFEMAKIRKIVGGDGDTPFYLYTKAIESDQKFAPAYLERAAIYTGESNYPAALEDYTKVIDLNYALETAYWARAGVYKIKKNYAKAVADYSKVIELNPENIYVYADRAVIYKERKEYSLAVTDLTKAIEIYQRKPESVTYFAIELYKSRADVYKKLKQKELAAADEKKYKELENKK